MRTRVTILVLAAALGLLLFRGALAEEMRQPSTGGSSTTGSTAVQTQPTAGPADQTQTRTQTPTQDSTKTQAQTRPEGAQAPADAPVAGAASPSGTQPGAGSTSASGPPLSTVPVSTAPAAPSSTGKAPAPGTAASGTPSKSSAAPAERLVDRQRMDVTGDGAEDTVELVGRGGDTKGYAAEHAMVMVEGRTGRRVEVALGAESAGYGQRMFLGDFDGDKTADVLIGLPTGGSGGITHYYLVSLAKGAPRYLVAPEVLLAGPRFGVSLIDGFQVKVDSKELGTSFITRLPAQPGAAAGTTSTDTYKDVFDAKGQLLKPANGYVDPYSLIEPVDLDHDGVYELVGYQSVWALYHANTVATVRSVWRRDGDTLKLTEATVRGLYTVYDYAQTLSKLDVAKPAEAMDEAVKTYREHLAQASPALRNAAFLKFREFQRKVASAVNVSIQPKLLEALGQKVSPSGTGAGGSLQSYINALNESADLRGAGLAVVYEGEGDWTVAPREGFVIEKLGALLTPAVRDYVAAEDTETNRRWAMDAAIVIPLKDLGTRVRAWEAYLAKYPDSPFRQEAQTYFRNQLRGLVFGLPNTPLFDLQTKKVRPEALDALERYSLSSGSGGSQSATLAGKVLALLRKYKYTNGTQLRAELNKLEASTLPVASK